MRKPRGQFLKKLRVHLHIREEERTRFAEKLKNWARSDALVISQDFLYVVMAIDYKKAK